MGQTALCYIKGLLQAHVLLAGVKDLETIVCWPEWGLRANPDNM